MPTRRVMCVEAVNPTAPARVVKRFELDERGHGRWVYTNPTPHAILQFMHGARGQNLVSRAQLDVARRFANGDFDKPVGGGGGGGGAGGGGGGGDWGPPGGDKEAPWEAWAPGPGGNPAGAGDAFPSGQALERVAADFRERVEAAAIASASTPPGKWPWRAKLRRVARIVEPTNHSLGAEVWTLRGRLHSVVEGGLGSTKKTLLLRAREGDAPLAVAATDHRPTRGQVVEFDHDGGLL